MINLRNYTLRELLVNCNKNRTVELRNKWDSRKHNPFVFNVFCQSASMSFYEGFFIRRLLFFMGNLELSFPVKERQF